MRLFSYWATVSTWISTPLFINPDAELLSNGSKIRPLPISWVFVWEHVQDTDLRVRAPVRPLLSLTIGHGQVPFLLRDVVLWRGEGIIAPRTMLDSCAHMLDKLKMSLAHALKVGHQDGLKMEAVFPLLEHSLPLWLVGTNWMWQSWLGKLQTSPRDWQACKHSGYTAKFRESNGGRGPSWTSLSQPSSWRKEAAQKTPQGPGRGHPTEPHCPTGSWEITSHWFPKSFSFWSSLLHSHKQCKW